MKPAAAAAAGLGADCAGAGCAGYAGCAGAGCAGGAGVAGDAGRGTASRDCPASPFACHTPSSAAHTAGAGIHPAPLPVDTATLLHWPVVPRASFAHGLAAAESSIVRWPGGRYLALAVSIAGPLEC